MEAITKPKVEIAPDLLDELLSQPQEEGQVILHCISSGGAMYGMYVRIWESTYLFDHNSGHQSELVHFENISKAPEWTYVEQGRALRYSLIFSGLPKGCKSFDLREVISEPNAFEVLDIKRNETDVYFVKLD